MTIGVSVVMPAYNEGSGIIAVLDRILDAVESDCEIVVVVDDESDDTLPTLRAYAAHEPRLRPMIQTYGRGPANAIRFGFNVATKPIVVVTMADGSDDPQMIDSLARLVDRGVVVAAASRYSSGGQQVGGPLLKGLMSRGAGMSLALLARVGTRDATNSFKAYSTKFVREVGIDSRFGFEIGLELTAKARRLRQPVAELPTIWLDRTAGESTFKLKASLPHYIRWYMFAFGKPLSSKEVRHKVRNRKKTAIG